MQFEPKAYSAINLNQEIREKMEKREVDLEAAI